MSKVEATFPMITRWLNAAIVNDDAPIRIQILTAPTGIKFGLRHEAT